MLITYSLKYHLTNLNSTIAVLAYTIFPELTSSLGKKLRERELITNSDSDNVFPSKKEKDTSKRERLCSPLGSKEDFSRVFHLCGTLDLPESLFLVEKRKFFRSKFGFCERSPPRMFYKKIFEQFHIWEWLKLKGMSGQCYRQLVVSFPQRLTIIKCSF